MRKTITISSNNESERESLIQLERMLLPWRCTWIDQRDDFGRDGFVQIVEPDQDGSLTLAGFSCFLQVKSIADAFSTRHKQRLKVGHLLNWTLPESITVIVAIWSFGSQKLRLRSALEIVSELDGSQRGWRDNDYAVAAFCIHHEAESPKVKDAIRSMVAAESCAFGEFLSEAAITRLVRFSGLVDSDEVVIKALLLYSTPKQHTWLVATKGSVFCVLDDAANRSKGTMLQWHIERRPTLRVSAKRTSELSGLVDFGEFGRWYYSPNLHPNEGHLAAKIRALFFP